MRLALPLQLAEFHNGAVASPVSIIGARRSARSRWNGGIRPIVPLSASGAMNPVVLEKISFSEGPVFTVGLEPGIELLQRCLAEILE